MSGTDAKVTTLFTIVGFPNKPSIAGSGGLYLIVPVKRDWYLDKGRLHPMLKLTRTQLPLMPAFAMTAHAAQGQTFSTGAIVDLRLGGSSSAMASYRN